MCMDDDLMPDKSTNSGSLFLPPEAIATIPMVINITRIVFLILVKLSESVKFSNMIVLIIKHKYN